MTLLTGDRVEFVDPGRGALMVSPASGREEVAFVTERVDGHVYVLPTDVLGLVSRGRLDRRLFDLTTLLEYGYDDARRADLPLIVQYSVSTSPGWARTRLAAGGSAAASDLAAARSVAVRQNKQRASAFWSAVRGADRSGSTLADGFDRIWLDGKRRLRIDGSVAQVGAPTAWAAGYTGAGVTVAVLDSGVDTTHPDLADTVVASRNFTDAPDDDLTGHGTHVASIIAGSGAASGGRYRGMAPAARIISGKVCTDLMCDESAVLAGMQWAAVEQHAKIVNLSVGGPDTPALDPVEEAVNTLSAQHGTLFVTSAGNSGTAPNGIESPGSADAALSVGSVTRADEFAEFSSRGPRAGDGAIKPDIAAPGVDIVAARARNGWIGTPVGDAYTAVIGSSAAAAHVAGAAALLASAHPDWSSGMLKTVLMNAAEPLPATSIFSVGAGRLNVGRAVGLPVVAEPGSLSLGLQPWPHTDDQPVVRTITYRNLGDSAVTVTLAPDLGSPSGGTAPPGMFTLSTATVAVPARGVGAVTLTVDTRGGVPVGLYTGRVVATVDGARVAATPFAIDVEPELYDLTLRHTDLAGQPTSDYYTIVSRLDVPGGRSFAYEPAELKLRLPKGAYTLMSFVNIDRSTMDPLNVFNYPDLMLDRDVVVDLDARQARPVRLTVPDRDATAMATNIGFDGRATWGEYGIQFFMPAGHPINTRRLGPWSANDQFIGRFETILARRGADGTFATTPYRYNLAWYVPGGLPTGFTRTVRRGQLATVDTTYMQVQPGLFGRTTTAPIPTNDWMAPGEMITDEMFLLPVTRAEYFSTRDVRWLQSVSEGTPETTYRFAGLTEPVAYRPGSHQRTRWYGAVVGPCAMGAPLTRTGNQFEAVIPLVCDGVPTHVGWQSSFDAGRTMFYRDGVLIGESDWPGFVRAVLPAEAGRYELSTELTPGGGDVSTRISATWTFESQYINEDWSQVPMLGVRFSPSLDDTNTAPANRTYTIPVTVEGASGRVTLTVQTSYDDGATWRAAVVKPSSDGWSVRVVHPAGAGHVSLRTQVSDQDGKALQQTIIRAYHIG